MRQPALERGGRRFTGVIDTLSAGYGIVNRHPWILAIPVLLDLFLWLGPQPSAARLVSQTLSQAVPAGAGTRMLDEAQARDLVEMIESFNLLSPLAPALVGVPSLMAVLGIRNPLRTTPIDSWALAVALLLGSLLVGMLLGSLYYSILAEEVGDGRVSLRRLGGHALRAWARVALYVVVLIVVSTVASVPVALMVVSLTMISPALGSLVLSAVMLAVIWIGIYLFFVPNAIFLSQVGPMQAVRNSVAIVRGHFWSATGIIVLITVVVVGMGRVWEFASLRLGEPWGLGFGILGNAYVVTGLIAGTMYFYGERIGHLKASRQ